MILQALANAKMLEISSACLRNFLGGGGDFSGPLLCAVTHDNNN